MGLYSAVQCSAVWGGAIASVKLALQLHLMLTSINQVTKLLEENAALHSRLAAKAMEGMAAGSPVPSSARSGGQTKMFEAPGMAAGCVEGV